MLDLDHSEEPDMTLSSQPNSSNQMFKLHIASCSEGYQNVIVIPLQRQRFVRRPGHYSALQKFATYSSVSIARKDDAEYVGSPFSSNSTGCYMVIQRMSDCTWHRTFVKKTSSFLTEIEALPVVEIYFPADNLQKLLAVTYSSQELFYERFDGEMFNSIRLQYHFGRHLERCQSEERLLDVDIRRATDVTQAYTQSFRLSEPSISCSQQHIHRFFHERLRENVRFRQFYGAHSPRLLQCLTPGGMSIEHFLDLALIINGRDYQNLRHHLSSAMHVLDPRKPNGLSSLPVAFGFGDGHGGNVMVSLGNNPAKILYLDYEVAGYHTPFLDFAKPIYMDGFFNVAYADLLYPDINQQDDCDEVSLRWAVEKGRIDIKYTLNLGPISKSLAVIKLEYTVRPVVWMLNRLAPLQKGLAEETLANALFSCALLTRDYSASPEVFILNLAVGVRLAVEMRQVFLEAFDWNHWPQDATAENGLQPNTERHASQQPIPRQQKKGHADNAVTYRAIRTCDQVEEINLSYIYRSLDFEVVFLKRETETFALHNHFSSTPENAGVLSRRIDFARKEALKVTLT